MFVRNSSHINDVPAFIALMSEKEVVINHKREDGSWFIYPGCRQAEGTYAFCGEAADYESLLKMLAACNKAVIINEE